TAAATGAFDSSRRRLVMYSGGEWPGTWALGLDGENVWSKLPDAKDVPSAREFQSAVYDPFAHRMVMFGGLRFDSESHYFPLGPSDETWALSLFGAPHWRLLETEGDRPKGYGQCAVVDQRRARMLVFGTCGQLGFGLDPEC